MFHFSKWLKTYRAEQNLSRPELAQRLCARVHSEREISQYTIGNWEQGKATPDIEVMLGVFRLAGVQDPYALVLGKSFKYHLNQAGVDELDRTARILEQVPDFQPAKQQVAKRILRFFQQPVSAGFGNFLDGGEYVEEAVGDEVPAEADYAVRISGNSMEPRFVDRQWIYVEESPRPLQAGDIGIFLYDSEAYCKSFACENEQVVLVSLNEAYKPIPVQMPEELRVLGKVVG